MRMDMALVLVGTAWISMDEWLSRCIPISFTLWYYFCALPKDSLELRWTSESQNLHYYMSWPILASKIEEMSNIGRLIVETRPGLGTYWCWYHLSGTHDGKYGYPIITCPMWRLASSVFWSRMGLSNPVRPILQRNERERKRNMISIVSLWK